MRKVALLFALMAAFTLSAAAQGSYGSAPSSDQTKPAKTKKVKNTSGGKETSLSGCLSGPNAENAYVLTNGRHRKGVEVGGLDELKDHVGHQVKLTGMWAKSGADIGENEPAGKSEKGERHFKVTKVTHVADSCTAPAEAKKKKST